MMTLGSQLMSRGMLQIVTSLTDYSSSVIYDSNMFIVQATGNIKPSELEY